MTSVFNWKKGSVTSALTGALAEAKTVAPGVSGLWTMPRETADIEAEVIRLQGEIAKMPARHEVEILKSQLRQCEDALAIRKLPGGNTTIDSYAILGRGEYAKLQTRALKLELDPEWVEFKIGEHDETPDKFTSRTNFFVGQLLTELEMASKKVQSEKKREGKATRKKERLLFDYPGPCAPAGFRADPVGDGTYKLASDESQGCPCYTEPEREKAVSNLYLWCEALGLTSDDMDAAWEALSGKLEGGHGKSHYRSNLCLWQTRLGMIAKQKYEQGVKMSETTTTAQAAAPVAATKPSLFARKKPEEVAVLKENPSAGTVDKPVKAEVIPSSAVEPVKQDRTGYLIPEDEWQEIRQALGIQEGFVIDTREKADWIAGKMHMAAHELAYVMERYAVVKPKLERSFTAIQERFNDRLEEFANTAMPGGKTPDGKKSMTLLYGSIGYRDKAESYSLDDDDKETALQGWIHTLSPALKERIGAKPIPRYSRNLDAIKALAKEQFEKGQGLPPAIKRTPAKPNEFFIGPSLDTLKKHIKEGKFK